LTRHCAHVAAAVKRRTSALAPRDLRTATAAIIIVIAAALGCAGPTAPTVPPVVPTPGVTPPPPPVPPTPPPPRLRVTRFLAFGDSLTEGEATPALWGMRYPTSLGPPKSYPYKLQTLLTGRYTDQTVEVWNGGLGGDRASAAQPRLVLLLEEFKPNVLILLAGVNDLNSGASIASTVDAIAALVREATGRGVQVLVSTLPPQDPRGFRGGNAAGIPPFNSALVGRVPSMGAQLADIFPAIALDMLAPDGLHLLQTGNQALAEAYFARIKDLFEEPAAAAARRR
jgi:lysophospholipase L1-like esterase